MDEYSPHTKDMAIIKYFDSIVVSLISFYARAWIFNLKQKRKYKICMHLLNINSNQVYIYLNNRVFNEHE